MTDLVDELILGARPTASIGVHRPRAGRSILGMTGTWAAGQPKRIFAPPAMTTTQTLSNDDMLALYRLSHPKARSTRAVEDEGDLYDYDGGKDQHEGK